jgi:hypothetical protein
LRALEKESLKVKINHIIYCSEYTRKYNPRIYFISTNKEREKLEEAAGKGRRL